MQCKDRSSLSTDRQLVYVTGTYNQLRQEGLRDRLKDRQIKHRVNLITSMRFRTWELSVICITETTDTFWERQNGNTITTYKQTNKHNTKMRQRRESQVHCCVTAKLN